MTLPYAHQPPDDTGVPILTLDRGPARQLRVSLFDAEGGAKLIRLREWVEVIVPETAGALWFPKPGRVLWVALDEVPDLAAALLRAVELTKQQESNDERL